MAIKKDKTLLDTTEFSIKVDNKHVPVTVIKPDKESLKKIKLHRIKIYPDNIRGDITPDNLDKDGLLTSVKSKGIISPLMLIPDSESPSEYFVIVGNRRLSCLREIYADNPDYTVPCIVINKEIIDEEDMLDILTIQYDENQKRTRLDISKEYEAIERIYYLYNKLDKKKPTSKEIGKILNISDVHVRKILGYDNLSVEEKKYVKDENLSVTAAVELSTADKEVKDTVRKEKIKSSSKIREQKNKEPVIIETTPPDKIPTEIENKLPLLSGNYLYDTSEFVISITIKKDNSKLNLIKILKNGLTRISKFSFTDIDN